MQPFSPIDVIDISGLYLHRSHPAVSSLVRTKRRFGFRVLNEYFTARFDASE
jgi:hypothetical protein